MAQFLGEPYVSTSPNEEQNNLNLFSTHDTPPLFNKTKMYTTGYTPLFVTHSRLATRHEGGDDLHFGDSKHDGCSKRNALHLSP